MSEPTLNLTITALQAKLGTFAGWGRGTAYGDPAWSGYQAQVIQDATESGLRRFYYPDPDPNGVTYDWSFLRPTAALSLAQGKSTIPLPDDFGGFEGQCTVLSAGPNSAQPWRIQWRTRDILRYQFSLYPELTGPPQIVALDPLKGTTGTAGQRSQLLVFPAADQPYMLQIGYFVNPDCMTAAFPYALGGPEHIETILESCLGIMEERLDDMAGVHAAAFQRRLVASIGMDRKKKPPTYGRNRDRSDDYGWDRSLVHYYAPACTYNGASMDQ